MKVLVLHSELGVLRGGGENFTRNVFSELAQRGHQVSAAFVADYRGRYPFGLPGTIQAIPIRGWWSRDLGQSGFAMIGRYIPDKKRYREQWSRVREAVSWRIFRWHNRRFMRRIESEFMDRWEDFDIVYVHGDTHLASVVAQHRPTVLRLPGPVTVELEPQLRRVHAVCANGDALIRIRTFLGHHAQELPVGIDTKLFKPDGDSQRPMLDWSKNDFVIGYVGRLSHIKGVDLIASAFKQVREIIPGLRLLVVGSGEEEKSLRVTLKGELAEGLVHIQPAVEHKNLGPWFRAMDLMLMPSRYENFSNVLLESMACGVPFLAADVGGNKLLAESGSGWLFQPDSANSIVARLYEILQQPAELTRRGRLGREYVEREHLWSNTAQLLEQIMKSVIGAT